jgi:hypothetical protein
MMVSEWLNGKDVGGNIRGLIQCTSIILALAREIEKNCEKRQLLYPVSEQKSEFGTYRVRSLSFKHPIMKFGKEDIMY